MRFLLHPVAVKTQTVPRGSQGLTAVVTQSKNTSMAIAPEHLKTKAWGQQCNPNCGCVLRFEATSCSKTDRILSASYTAKQMLADAQGRVQFTNRSNRPMMTDCKCLSLNHLATAVVDNLLLTPRSTWQRVKSQLEFDSTRSSPSFAKAVLSSQKLPLQSTGCFDLVEEALTALMKGYLPKQRTGMAFKGNTAVHSEPLDASSSKSDYSLIADYDGLSTYDHFPQQPFSGLPIPFFGEAHNTAASADRLTMLEFVDQQHSKMLELSMKKYSNINSIGQVPVDWVDYVDRMFQEEQHSNGGKRSREDLHQSA